MVTLLMLSMMNKHTNEMNRSTLEETTIYFMQTEVLTLQLATHTERDRCFCQGQSKKANLSWF